MTDTAPEFLTVRELADLLRVKERKVYDLASSGQLPVSRATGKLLFPEAEVRAWIDGNRSGPTDQIARPNVLLGSHDPLLEWAIRQSQSGIASLLDGSADGLARFNAGEGVAAGMHIRDTATGGWNIDAVQAAMGDQNAVLVSWATRRRGLVARAEDAARFRTIDDLAGRKVVARQKESGAEVLLAHLLTEAGLAASDIAFTDPVRSEQDGILAVVEGQADATFGLEALARPYGLSFQPLVDERFDILIDRRAYFESPMQKLLAFCSSDDFADKAKLLGGYDVENLGQVLWNP